LIEERPIGAGLNRNLGSPTAPGEAVEQELDAFISRRDADRVKSEGERVTEEAWMESERRYNARRHEENRLARVEYHSSQVVRLRAVLESLIAGHEEQVAKLTEAQPKGAA
jgi:hypothetical protein